MISDLWWWLHSRHDSISNALRRALLFCCGAHIGSGARFAGKPCFPHGLHGIFISGGAQLGTDCVLFQHVTIGSNTLADSTQGPPSLGNQCFIGAGACVIGGITLGDGVRVGAGTTVVSDVPAHALVVSAPSRIIAKDAPMDNRFRRRRDDGSWEVYEAGQYRPERSQ